ncbi:MAG TPA: hypothetical protein VFZ66_04045 [Herpetosiphonaceae bacterium]
MADFLTRLAERALGLAPTIQPVLPSLFAPGAPPIDSAAIETEIEAAVEQHAPRRPRPRRGVFATPDDEAADDEPAASSPPVDRHSSPRPQQSARAATIEPLAGTSQESALRPDERHRIGVEPAAERTAQALNIPLARTPAAAEPRATSPAASIERAADRAIHRIEPIDSAAPGDDGPSTRVPLDAAQPPEAPRPRPAEDRTPRVQPRQERTTLLPAPPAQPTTIRPAQRERAEGLPTVAPIIRETRERATTGGQSALSASEQPAAPPTQHIHVSIGRIDVRAVTPTAPPAPRPSAPSAPKMSLDDYLRAQKGGRR